MTDGKTASPLPTREDLIDLCERGLVPQSKWRDRDSAKAQLQLGEARVLLRAGCDFTLAGSPLSTEDTWWIEVVYRGFGWFEEHEMYDETFYIPTAQRLAKRAGNDWY